MTYFRGSELQNYFKKLIEDQVKAIIKPQYVDNLPKAVKGIVKTIFEGKDEKKCQDEVIKALGKKKKTNIMISFFWNILTLYFLTELQKVLDRSVEDLSGGELQRFAIGVVMIQEANVYLKITLILDGNQITIFSFFFLNSYMFDEPSSYLDVAQRLRAARSIRSLLNNDTYIIVVEHDLSVLDYLSDFICVLYGTPGAYGVVTLPFSVREGFFFHWKR